MAPRLNIWTLTFINKNNRGININTDTNGIFGNFIKSNKNKYKKYKKKYTISDNNTLGIIKLHDILVDQI